jgi:two-component system chemotaxis sensor kinase CheA
MGLAHKSNVVSEGKDRSVHEASGQGADAESTKQPILVFRISEARRMAIPLSKVARLEEFQKDAVETCGGQRVVQYRGQIMPLLALSDVLADERLRLLPPTDSEATAKIAPPKSGKPTPGANTLQVIVYTKEERSVGLIVDRIMDVVEETLVIQRTGVGRGVLGSAVIEKKVTEMLDVEAMFQIAMPDIPAQSLVQAA